MASVHKLELIHPHTNLPTEYILDCVIGSNLSISGDLESGEVFYKEKLGQKLKLGKKDYPTLKKFYDDKFYEEITYIEESCGVEIFRGVFTVLNGSFCEDNCTAEFNIIKNDVYDCLEKGDKDINFFQLPVSIETTCSDQILSLEFDFQRLPFCSTSTGTTIGVYGSFDVTKWNEWGREVFPELDAFGNPTGNSYCDSYRILVRQFKNVPDVAGVPSPPNGSGWVYESPTSGVPLYSKFVRPYTLSATLFASMTALNQGFWWSDNTVECSKPQNITITDINGEQMCGQWDLVFNTSSITCYDRNRRLDDTLLELAKLACPGITCFNSDFLNSATNYVTGQPNCLNDLLIAEKSDMADPTSSNPATKEQINFFDLYDNIKEMFDVRFFIDGSGCLNIEHISTYFNNQIDLRSYEVSCFCCWEIDNDNIPVREKFEFHESEGLDFKGVPIEYNPIVANGDEENRKADLITTDIEFIQTTLKSEQSLDGFVITVNEPDGSNFKVKNEVGELSGNNLINGHLSWANLHENYHKDWKYLPSGELNNNQINFDSTRPIRKNKTNIYKMTPTEFNAFRNNITGSSVITSCGVGIVDSYKYEYKYNLLRLEVTLF